MGEELFAQNPLDRGYLVRRLAPAWGTTEKMAKTANDNTFHFTNCTPQHHAFNAGQTLWVGLEDYILRNARKAKNITIANVGMKQSLRRQALFDNPLHHISKRINLAERSINIGRYPQAVHAA